METAVTISGSSKKDREEISLSNTFCIRGGLYRAPLHIFHTLFPPPLSPLLVSLSLFPASSSLFHISSFSLSFSAYLRPCSVLLHSSYRLPSSFRRPVTRSPLVSGECVFHWRVTLSHVTCVFGHAEVEC